MKDHDRKYDRQVIIRVDQATYDKLLAWAEEGDRSIAAECRRAIRKYLAGDLDA